MRQGRQLEGTQSMNFHSAIQMLESWQAGNREREWWIVSVRLGWQITLIESGYHQCVAIARGALVEAADPEHFALAEVAKLLRDVSMRQKHLAHA
jgi:hypothetical protein